VSTDEPESLPNFAETRKPRSKGYAGIAWAVATVLVLVSILVQDEPAENNTGSNSQDRVQQSALELQGKYLVAASQIPGMQNERLFENSKSLDTGPQSARLRFCVLAGEIIGPDKAISQLDSIEASRNEADAPLAPPEERVLGVLRRAYTDYGQGKWDAPSLNSTDRRLLEDELGWFGALALAPMRTDDGGAESVGGQSRTGVASPARQAVMAEAWRMFAFVIFVAMMMMGLGVAGLGGAITFVVLVISGKIQSAISAGTDHNAIYAETFAVWLLLFTILSVIASLVVSRYPDTQIVVSTLGSMSSLAALFWPMLRGVSWHQTRHDIGWYLGPKPLREIVWGLVCYVSNIPVVLMGFLAMLILLQLYSVLAGGPAGLESVQPPAHPIIDWVRETGWAGRIHIVLLACLIAPGIEETVFRGILYRHLRGSTAGWRTGISVAFSTALNSLIFAVIHPQGLLAAPALMAVAVGLSLVREWRGSLLAPMAMHGINNGVVMAMLFVLL